MVFDIKQNGLTCNATTRTASLALCVSDLVTITVKDNSEAAMDNFKCLLEVQSKLSACDAVCSGELSWSCLHISCPASMSPVCCNAR